MTTDRFGVRHAELITHAGQIEEVGGKVATAAAAGSAVRAGGDAYGKLCAMVPVVLNALQDVLIDGINAAAESLRDTGGRLRATATDYEAIDQRRATVFKSIGEDM
jgi:hypothetical protein